MKKVLSLLIVFIFLFCTGPEAFGQYEYEKNNVDLAAYDIKSIKASTHYGDKLVVLMEDNLDQYKVLLINRSGEVESQFDYNTGLENSKINKIIVVGDELYTVIRIGFYPGINEAAIISQNLLNGEITTQNIEREALEFKIDNFKGEILLSYVSHSGGLNLEVLNKSDVSIKNHIELPTEFIDQFYGYLISDAENGINIKLFFTDYYQFYYTFNLSHSLEVNYQYEHSINDPLDETFDKRDLTYYNNEVRFQSIYTPADGVVKFVSIQGCDSLRIETLDENYNYLIGLKSVHQLDQEYYIFVKNGSCAIYSCKGLIVNEINVEVDNWIGAGEYLYNYKFGADQVFEIHRLIKQPICEGDILISSQAEVNSFNTACSRVKGDIVIDDGLDGMFDIVNLDGLGNIIEIDGNLVIRNNSQLTDLIGLSKLSEIKDTIEIINNESLSACSQAFLCNHIYDEKPSFIFNNSEACESIENVIGNCSNCPDGDVDISTCVSALQYGTKYKYCTEINGDLSIGGYSNLFNEPLIIELSIFENIKKVNGYVRIRLVQNMTETLASLNIEHVTGSVEFIANNENSFGFPLLHTIDGGLTLSVVSFSDEIEYDFTNLKEIGGVLYMWGLNVRDLKFFSKLDSIHGDLILEGSNTITSLEDLESLKYVGGSIEITNNDSLSYCSILPVCNRISQGSENITIEDNTGDCKDKDSVKPNCNFEDLDLDGFYFFEDCDDLDSLINPMAIDIPYNGIDDDCDPETVDDDLDGDGFLLAEDCDDMDATINPNAFEIVYNGIDDDCDSETLDDDLDQDGFILANDCDDMDPDINPDAEEIVNNGIDEDCDGLDLVTSTSDLAKANIKVYPNPTSSRITIAGVKAADFYVQVYNLIGELILEPQNSNSFSVQNLEDGIYLLKIIDLENTKVYSTKICIAK